ncbi:hypothetical protein E1B28_013039 [Marasmius oreades]|uniref:Mid2 domain-containing protein n=1 Tax=Marasmius oreades TaxID=181124 RepID=A0A9P7RQ59_9AGAR|nr:uncharacterized protein E1B28_013039 [Marasmius oreades]KAG7087058.1 hypothetical protein E1B28_013039 [Marasmius oreades]
MGRYRLIICTLVFSCLTSTAFQINPPLPTAPVIGQVISFNWTRDLEDPDEFSFREFMDVDGHGLSLNPLSVDNAQARQRIGSFTLTMTQIMTFKVVAVDMNDLNTFFTAPGVIEAAVSPDGTTTSSLHNVGTPVASPLPGLTSAQATTSSPISPAISIENPTPASTQTSLSTVTATVLTNSEESQPHKSSTGAIACGTIGGVVLLVVSAFVFYILKRRNKKLKHKQNLAPYLDAKPCSGSDSPYMDIRERRAQIIEQRARLQRELEAYDQSSQESNSRSGAVPDGINESNQEEDVVQVLRRQMEVVTRIMATLEAGMAPPDYSSDTQ